MIDKILDEIDARLKDCSHKLKKLGVIDRQWSSPSAQYTIGAREELKQLRDFVEELHRSHSSFIRNK